MAGASLGQQIDSELARDETAYVFAVVATRESVICCYVVAKPISIPVNAIRHVDYLKSAVALQILRHADLTGNTPQ